MSGVPEVLAALTFFPSAATAGACSESTTKTLRDRAQSNWKQITINEGNFLMKSIKMSLVVNEFDTCRR